MVGTSVSRTCFNIFNLFVDGTCRVAFPPGPMVMQPVAQSYFVIKIARGRQLLIYQRRSVASTEHFSLVSASETLVPKCSSRFRWCLSRFFSFFTQFRPLRGQDCTSTMAVDKVPWKSLCQKPKNGKWKWSFLIYQVRHLISALLLLLSDVRFWFVFYKSLH